MHTHLRVMNRTKKNIYIGKKMVLFCNLEMRNIKTRREKFI